MLLVVKVIFDLNLLVVDYELIIGNWYEFVFKSNSYEDENWYMFGILRLVLILNEL